MNDNNPLGTVRDSLTTAKDSLTDVHMNTPAETIVRLCRARRRQRARAHRARPGHWPWPRGRQLP